MVDINLNQKVAAPAIQIRDVLLQHEQLDRFFNATFKLVKKQDEGEIKGGKGTIRQVTMSGVTFNEEIIDADDNQICYRIMGNKPVADHSGEIRFVENNKNAVLQTDISYEIKCKAPWWLPNFILSYFIKKDISRALQKLASSFKDDVK